MKVTQLSHVKIGNGSVFICACAVACKQYECMVRQQAHIQHSSLNTKNMESKTYESYLPQYAFL